MSNGENQVTVPAKIAIWVAVVGVLAAIGGGLAGSAVTFFGSDELQETQFEQAEELAATEARGTARVVQQIFRSADNVFAASLRDCKYAYQLKDLEATIPYAERKVLAPRLSANDWAAVALGLELLKRQVDRSRVEPFTREFAIPQVEKARDAMFKGQKAVAELADTAVTPIDDVAAGC